MRGVYSLSPVTAGGRVLLLAMSFAAIVVVCMYIASYSAGLAVRFFKLQITSVQDLANRPVAIGTVGQKRVEREIYKHCLAVD